MSCRCRLRASVAKQVSRSKCRAVAKQVSEASVAKQLGEATVAKQVSEASVAKQVSRSNLSRSEAPLVAHTKKDETTQAQKQLLSTEKQTDMCVYRSQKQPCARCERLVSCFWWLCFAGIPYTWNRGSRGCASEATGWHGAPSRCVHTTVRVWRLGIYGFTRLWR
jgi:hypothetical protein